MGDIDVRKWVMEAGVKVDGSPLEDDYPGSWYHAPDEERKAQKTIAGFYRICASDGFNRKNVTQYLINKKIGQKGDELSDEDWRKIEAIREVAKSLYCDVTLKY